MNLHIDVYVIDNEVRWYLRQTKRFVAYAGQIWEWERKGRLPWYGEDPPSTREALKLALEDLLVLLAD